MTQSFKLFAFLVLIISHVGYSQTNKRGTNYLEYFEGKSRLCVSKTWDYHLSCARGETEKKSEAARIAALTYTTKVRNEVQGKEDFLGQQSLKNSYLKMLDACIKELETSAFNKKLSPYSSQLDSLKQFRDGIAKSWGNVNSEAINLKKAVDGFVITNRISDKTATTSIPQNTNLSFQRIGFAFSVFQPLEEVRESKRIFLRSLMLDTGNLSEEKRQNLILTCENGTTLLKAMAPFPGEKDLKTAALNSLRLYRMEAVNELNHIMLFAKLEKEFISLHQQMKTKTDPTDAEKLRYKKVTNEYNQNLKITNDLYQCMEKKCLDHEKIADGIFIDFLGQSYPTK